MIVRCLFTVSLLIVNILLTQPCRAETYDFVSIAGLYEQQVGAIVLPEVYKKLGIDITITAMPGKRAMLEAVSGRKDGEIMRIWSYSIEHSDMVRVPTPYYQLETMGFFKSGADVAVSSVKDLARYSLLKVRGVKHTNNITAGLKSVYDYDDSESMFRALSTSRNSIALTHTADGIFAINKFALEDIMLIEQPLATFPLYHYVHKKNAHLVEKVDRVIREMKDSGELATLIALAEKKVFQLNGLPF